MTNAGNIKFLLSNLKFNDQGLIPAISQQHDSKEVLMLAWMNREAISETLSTGRVCFYSRSRKKLWRKGESSGQIQRIKEMRWDCDLDTLLLLVDQKGVACHTGRRNCFFNAIQDKKIVITAKPIVDPRSLYK